jgi:ATP-dependent DNA helicase RecQ
MSSLAAAQSALREHFGFDSFRETQPEVITSILEGRDTIVVMPTGGGKSLCYQLPALMRDGATVVISPLIALMKDQVDALHARGLPATFINSSLDYEEQRERIAGVRRGQYKLVYVAPERFRSSSFTNALRDASISFFAVDEAHCVSSWGHDFRPDYLRLKDAITALGRPQIVALTATATPYVRADIIEQLGLRDPVAYVSGFDRPNLAIQVVHTEKEHEKLAHVRRLSARHTSGSGIVYTSTRKSVEATARKLQTAGLRAIAYHAGMEETERTRAQESFMRGDVQMIVATNAFGMGIDKSDIRFVIHHHLPGSIEAYYQEIGRAGRDGAPSDCVLLFNYADKRTQDFFIEGSFPPPELIARVYETLAGDKSRTNRTLDRRDRQPRRARNEMAVQSALITLEKAGHIERGTAAENRAAVRLLMTPHLARAAVTERRSPAMQQVLFGLLGGCEVNERGEKEINVADFADTLGMDITAAKRALGTLAGANVISYQPARRTRGVRLLDSPPARTLRIRPADIARRAALEQRKLREVINFSYTDQCFRRFILGYFGDRSMSSDCGTCGNCRKH